MTYFNKDHTSDSRVPVELISQLTLASLLALHSASGAAEDGNAGKESRVQAPVASLRLVLLR